MLIRSCVVDCKILMLCNDDLIGPVGNEIGCERGNTAAEKYGSNVLAVVCLEFLRLGQKFECSRK